MKVNYIQECTCGAICVTFANGAMNSMSRQTFESLKFEGEWLPDKFCNCNHCINHWGIDLCICGSGEPVGKCSCGRTAASEELGKKRPFIGFAFTENQAYGNQ